MSKGLEILVIEDNPGDATLLREAFAEEGSSVELSFARDGMEALRFLRRENASILDLIVLDLKMPGMDGLTFLREMRAEPSLKDITVVVLTGSDAPRDREAALSLGAKHYLLKPSKLDGWILLSRRLEEIALHDRCATNTAM